MDNRGIDKSERVCYNCQHMLWMVGIGAGVRCGVSLGNRKTPPIIPNLRHTCKLFEFRKKEEVANEKQS